MISYSCVRVKRNQFFFDHVNLNTRNKIQFLLIKPYENMDIMINNSLQMLIRNKCFQNLSLHRILMSTVFKKLCSH